MATSPTVRHYPGLVDYLVGWEEQRNLHTRRVADEVEDTIMLLQHDPVYTAGRRTLAHERPLPGAGAPTVDVDRGGKITWHGPGQLVGYPIVALGEPIDVVAYVRRLEALLIEACARLGVHTERIRGRSGVWVPEDDRGPARKLGAIGIRVAQGVTMHGFALNCDCDLAWYERIVPCGIADAGVTSLTRETGHRVEVAAVQEIVEAMLPVLHETTGRVTGGAVA